jgi:thymidine kinase
MSCPVISIDASSPTTGFLDVIIGPMYSGKTDYLLRELNIFSIMGARVLYVNHSLDTRGEVFSSHNPLISSDALCKIDTKKVFDVAELISAADDYLVIGIDEAQFFNGLKDAVMHLVEEKGKRVLVAGLSGNYLREPFGDLIQLIPVCDRITKLSSCCSICAKAKQIKQAHFSHRIHSEMKKQILVGAKDEYIPLCRECFIQTTKEIEENKDINNISNIKNGKNIKNEKNEKNE